MNKSGTVREPQRLIQAQSMSEGAGVRIRRTIGAPAVGPLDPFLLLDEFKSDRPDEYLAGFPDHPHRGFETVTYMLAGHMQHRDHQGNEGDLGPGSLQWMTAGRGIVHSEMPRQEQGLMWGFQLWVNLPASRKMLAPRYQDIPASEIPELKAATGVMLRLLAGSCQGVDAPVTGVAVTPLYLDIHLANDGYLEQPLSSSTALCYVYDGQVAIGTAEAPLASGTLAVLGSGDLLRLRAAGSGRCLLIAGEPIGEPIVWYGPFVMNTREEIHQALADLRAGRFLAEPDVPVTGSI